MIKGINLLSAGREKILRRGEIFPGKNKTDLAILPGKIRIPGILRKLYGVLSETGRVRSPGNTEWMKDPQQRSAGIPAGRKNQKREKNPGSGKREENPGRRKTDPGSRSRG